MHIEHMLLIYSAFLTLISLAIFVLIAVYIIKPVLKIRMKKRFHCNLDGCTKSFYTLKGLFRHIVINHDTVKGKDTFYV